MYVLKFQSSGGKLTSKVVPNCVK